MVTYPQPFVFVPARHSLLQGGDSKEPEANNRGNLTTRRSLKPVMMVRRTTTMLSSTNVARKPFNTSNRGYHAVYHEGEVNHCPGCGRTHWLIGLLSAESAVCSAAE